jgi:hypothetical protein
MMVIAATIVGWMAQSRKGRAGAKWAFFTFFLMLPIWFVLYFGTAMVDLSLYKRDEGWYALGVSGGVGILMAIIVAIIPDRRAPESPRSEQAPGGPQE